jgi:hypothetical protein
VTDARSRRRRGHGLTLGKEGIVRETVPLRAWRVVDTNGPAARIHVVAAPDLTTVDHRRLIQDDHDNEFILDAELIVRLSAERGSATRSTSTCSLQVTSRIWMPATTALALAGCRPTYAIPKLQ